MFEYPPDDYIIEFNITLRYEPPSYFEDDQGKVIRTSIMRFQNDYSRIVFWYNKLNTKKIQIATGMNARGYWITGETNMIMPTNEELRMKLQVEGDLASIYINGQLDNTWLHNPAGGPKAALPMYIGDPFYKAAPAVISNIRYSGNLAPTISAPTTTSPPTTTFQGQDYEFKNFESRFVDDVNGFTISLNYTVGKSVNRVNVTLLDKNCTSENIDSIINLVADQSADSNVHFLKKVSVNKQELTTSDLVTRSEGSSKGTLSFCVKAESLSENNMSVTFQQDKLNLSYDLTENNFEILANGLQSNDINTTLTSVTSSYSIIANRCNSSTYEAIDQATALKQNGLVFICIKPNSTDVEITTFSLDFVQPDYTFPVVDGGG